MDFQSFLVLIETHGNLIGLHIKTLDFYRVSLILKENHSLFIDFHYYVTYLFDCETPIVFYVCSSICIENDWIVH